MVQKEERVVKKSRTFNIPKEVWKRATSNHFQIELHLTERSVVLTAEQSHELLSLLCDHIDRRKGYIPVTAVSEQLAQDPTGFFSLGKGKTISHLIKASRQSREQSLSDIRDSFRNSETALPIVEYVSTDGSWYLCKLLNAQHLCEEASEKRQNNCIDDFYYIDRVQRGVLEIFSVRSTSAHESIFTISYDPKKRTFPEIGDKENYEPNKYNPIKIEVLQFLQSGVGYDYNGNPFLRGFGDRHHERAPKKEYSVEAQMLDSVIETLAVTNAGTQAYTMLFSNLPLSKTQREALQSIVEKNVNAKLAYRVLRSGGNMLPEHLRKKFITTILKSKNESIICKAYRYLACLSHEEKKKMLTRIESTRSTYIAAYLVSSVQEIGPHTRTRLVNLIAEKASGKVIDSCFSELTFSEQKYVIKVLKQRKMYKSAARTLLRICYEPDRVHDAGIKDKLIDLIIQEGIAETEFFISLMVDGVYAKKFTDVQLAKLRKKIAE